jgi:hypothetical protein
MSLVTATRTQLPDFEYEYHSITVDTIGQDSKNTFTVHLTQPLENIVQARLSAARIDAVGSNVCHISIDELNTNYAQRTSNVFEGQANMTTLNNAFGTLIQDGSNPIIFKNEYDVTTQYVTPIRKVDRLTCTLRDENGATITDGSDNFLIFKFVCKNKNMPFLESGR